MTLEEFKKEIKELEKSEEKILKLKDFLMDFHIAPEYICIKYSDVNNYDKEYYFHSERIKKMSENTLKDYIDGYKSKIKNLRENGLNIKPNPKIIKEI